MEEPKRILPSECFRSSAGVGGVRSVRRHRLRIIADGVNRAAADALQVGRDAVAVQFITLESAAGRVVVRELSHHVVVEPNQGSVHVFVISRRAPYDTVHFSHIAARHGAHGAVRPEHDQRPVANIGRLESRYS